ncbi:transcriptional regulator [Citrobacter cronae]|uniref:PapB/FocB family fimbrial expression transcriptional regulator n=1 Tax=Citrobacter cronae TaxID=1748967 RepID=UPI0018FF42EB|nr:PapB/FocB family fimbrial expression transcriptional regulator [Citrobacter cronae]MBJ8362579.1 transcriptional regulator [Citrobacter cronae]
MCTQQSRQSEHRSFLREGGEIPGTLKPGDIDICHFRLLVAISMIKRKNMQYALEDVLVRGRTRREACEKHNVSQSHFSVKYRQLQMVSHTVVRIYPFIKDDI